MQRTQRIKERSGRVKQNVRGGRILTAGLAAAMTLAGCAPPPSPEAPFFAADDLRREGRRADAIAAYDRALRQSGEPEGRERGPRGRYLEARTYAGLVLLDAYRALEETPGLRERAPRVEQLRAQGVDLRRRAQGRLIDLRGMTIDGVYRRLEPEYDVERYFLLLSIWSSSDEPLFPAFPADVPPEFRDGVERLLREGFRRDLALLAVRKARAYGIDWSPRQGDVAASLRRWGDALDRLAAAPGIRPEYRDSLVREARQAALLALEPGQDAVSTLPVDEPFYRLSPEEHLAAATRAGGEGVNELAHNGPTERARERFLDAFRHLAFGLAVAEDLGAADRRRPDDLPSWLYNLHRCSRAE